MKKKIFLEGGGSARELHVRCRAGFRKLLEKCGYVNQMPRLVACGSRREAFDDFCSEHSGSSNSDFVALLVDSESTPKDAERTWDHLKNQDNWDRPDGSSDEQVLFMTTSMETWIVADRITLRNHYGPDLQESGLPSLENLEARSRMDVQSMLQHSTKNCKNAYQKGKRSFRILGNLDPSSLISLSSFKRIKRILDSKLQLRSPSRSAIDSPR
ncbi:MAG: DUF4276 family protein [Bacteroidota bacterium]